MVKLQESDLSGLYRAGYSMGNWVELLVWVFSVLRPSKRQTQWFEIVKNEQYVFLLSPIKLVMSVKVNPRRHPCYE